MQRKFFCSIISILALACAGSLSAAERTWNFTGMTAGQPPQGCHSTVAGEGKPGTWKLVMDEFPLALQPLSSTAPKTAPKAVVGQVARDYSDRHFPMLILGDDSYGDFDFKTKFKIVDGLTEQSAGIAFRIQDEKNFYYVQADAVANRISLHAFLKGQHTLLYSKDIKIPKGTWHDVSINAEGPRFNISLDGQDVLKVIERTYSIGRIAFCTKSDSIAYFADARIKYTPKEPFVQVIVRDAMKEYPRLEAINIFMVPPRSSEIRLVASSNEGDIGQPAEKIDADVINRGVNYYRKDKELVYITMPLRDRNGDPVAAVRLVMKTFHGQTEENALARATPVLKKMQARASIAESLF